MAKEQNGFGVASFVLGVLTIVIGWIPFFGIPFCLLGFIFGILQAKRFNNGLNIAGICLNSLGLLWQVLMVFFLIVGLSMGA